MITTISMTTAAITMIATTIDMGRAFADNGGGGGVRRSRIGVVLELAKTAGPVVTARSVAEKQLLERQQLAIGTWLLAKKKANQITTKDTKESQATEEAQEDSVMAKRNIFDEL